MRTCGSVVLDYVLYSKEPKTVVDIDLTLLGKEATAEPGTSSMKPAHESDDSDMEIVEDEEMEEEKSSAPKKRKTEDSDAKDAQPAKKPRTSVSDDCQIVDLC